MKKNFFPGTREIPEKGKEIITEIFENDNLRIERIVTNAHYSLDDDWYDQDEDEWVLLLQGDAKLEFEDNKIVEMSAGDYIFIDANYKHRVVSTSPTEPAVWLAIFIDKDEE